nr:uncharacterized protein LOC113711575 [Coffea arabica]
MTDLLAHVVKHQGQHSMHQPENPANNIEGEDRILERFQKFSSPKFLRGPDPDAAKRWLKKMIDIFAALHYTEERQVTFAVFQLEGTARSWWNVIRTMWEREQTPRTWDLAVAQINTFNGAVEKALRVENARLQVRNFQVRKRGFPENNSGQGEKGNPPKFERGTEGVRLPGVSQGISPRGGPVGRGQQRSASQESSASVSRRPCRYCGKPNHTEDNCWRKERKCLRCGSAEHQITNCPIFPREARVTPQSSKANFGQSKVDETRQKMPTRVYSLEQRQVPDSSEIVEGTIPVFHRLVRILIEPGATHFFVNPDFMCRIDIKPVNLPYDLKVSTPTGTNF